MSDCEGLPVGKRQIYIYPSVLPAGSHSQIAQSHAKPLAFKGSRSRSRERRNSRKLCRCWCGALRVRGAGLGRVVMPGSPLKAQGLEVELWS